MIFDLKGYDIDIVCNRSIHNGSYRYLHIQWGIRSLSYQYHGNLQTQIFKTRPKIQMKFINKIISDEIRSLSYQRHCNLQNNMTLSICKMEGK